MANTGTSYKFDIGGQAIKEVQQVGLFRYDAGTVNPPSSTKMKGNVSVGITKWINPYPDIAFQKIICPQWGDSNISNAYALTTNISNQPDYIKDYYFISLMRCIDFYNDDTYSAVIHAQSDGVKPFGVL